MDKEKGLKIILWAARIIGTLVIIFLLFMTVGELFTDSNITAISSSDMIALLLFPISTVIGLLLAFKWKGLGGLITIGGIMLLHILRPEIASSFLINSFALPGLLYVIYSVWSKN